MSPPWLTAQRFLAACLWGCVLGMYYGFLRPLRKRTHWPADLLFVPGLFYIWLVIMFGVCRGDLRFGYTVGMFLGWFIWERTGGRLLRPLFLGFWGLIWRVLGWICCPIQKILKKTCNFTKKYLLWEKNGVQ